MRVDLHVHTCYSRDSLSPLAGIVQACRRRGLDRVAITDHGTIEGALALRQMAPELVIVGQEIKTTAGELIAYYVQEQVPAGLTSDEAIGRLREQGAVVGVSHPLDRLRREAMGRAALLRIVDKIDCLETFNARVLWPRDNQAAAELARERGLPATAGSDAHDVASIGVAWVEMPAFQDRDDFLANLRLGTIGGALSSPLVHLGSTYAKLRRRLSAASGA